MHGDIETASGPWNSSGNWWKSEHWNREEWDIAIRAIPNSEFRNPNSLLLLVSRDVQTNRWYAEGIYD
jgi:protein ImuB